jgi:signal transduction histidine kinase/ActR/RegA family two-component response regulator
MTNRRKDGSLYPEEMTITPVPDADGGITHFIALKRDLTQEKQAEARFLQSQKMEVVGRLAGGIAHDFNNLLTVINGTAELASSDLPAGDPLRADLQEILRAGVSATSLTRQLLAFSRKQVVRPEVLNLSREVAGMQSMLQRLIGEDVALVISVVDEGRVKADAGQLEQVVMNLIVNARDAMPDGGVLTITADTVDLDRTQVEGIASECLQPGPHVRLVVCDTGTGIDAASRSRIFEPFFTTKEQGKGTGLGLATVFAIVAQSGGGIAVDSEPGRGTAFSIYLPRVTDLPAARPSAAPAPPVAVPSETILVVEDEDRVRHLVQRMLESLGYRVLTAGDAVDAVRILEQLDTPVHLLLTDVVMPGMSGPVLAEWLARVRPETGILFSSGHTDNAALRAGAIETGRHFISKPYARAELARKVREMLDWGTDAGEAIDRWTAAPASGVR